MGNPLTEFMGHVKAAEMELSEAAFKAGDAEIETAVHCLEAAERQISLARDALVRAVHRTPESASDQSLPGRSATQKTP